MNAIEPYVRSIASQPPVDPSAEFARTLASRVGRDAEHHLNAAGASLPTAEVVETVHAHLRLEAEIGGYEAAGAALTRLEAVYDAAAAMIGASANEIALIENATVGWQRLVSAMRLGHGDRVIATRSTYVSGAMQLLELSRAGVTVEIAPVDPDGRTDLDALAGLLRQPANLVASTHVPTSSGTVEPVHEIGLLAHAAHGVHLLDATQSVGQIPLDVSALPCDALVTTGRKFLRAPRGTGFLYVDAGLGERLRPTTPDVRGALWSADREFELQASARRFESWEAAHALRLGLGQALAEAGAFGVERVEAHVVRLAHSLRRALLEVPGVRLAEPAETRSGIVTFVRDGERPSDTLAQLTAAGCHVVTVPAAHGRWDMGPKGLDAVVRVSFHVYNDDDDVDAVLAALSDGRPTRRQAASGNNHSAPTDGHPNSTSGRRAPRHGDGADVIVIGAGVHGRSAAWQLARRGASVLILERLRPGHTQGSSHGRTRMIRKAYPSPVWGTLLEDAYAAWSDLEAELGEPLITTTGGLYAHLPQEGGLDGAGCSPVDVAAARAIAPALMLGPEYKIVHDPAAGIIDAEAAMRALADLGGRSGVRLHDSCPALEVREDGDGVEVVTPRGVLHSSHVIAAAGPWMGTLFEELAGSLHIERIVNVHLPRRDVAGATTVFAVACDEGLLYGIPAFRGAGLKVGLDDGPREDPNRLPAPVTAAEVERVRQLVRRFLPDCDGEPEETLACRYTVTPSRRFAVGPLPDRPRVLVASACSGHGFKFGPALGAALADLVSGKPRPDLAFIDPAITAMAGSLTV